MQETRGGFEWSRSVIGLCIPLHKTFSLLKKKKVCVQKRVARRAQSSAAEADMDEFRAGIHNDRGFGNNFRSEQGP